MGSSSSFVVGLLNIISKYKNLSFSNKELAKKVFFLKKKILKEQVGIQDQISASIGGFNKININKKVYLVLKRLTQK